MEQGEGGARGGWSEDGAGPTDAVLVVHVVDLVDPQTLPLVQLLLLEHKENVCQEEMGGAKRRWEEL